jgi:UDP-N-acetylmuramoylalanine-D-glutamate ligase
MEFRNVIRDTKRRIIKNPQKLIEKQNQIDFQALEEKAKLENNKVLIICSPRIPVCRVWTKEELRQVVRVVKRMTCFLFQMKYIRMLSFLTINSLLLCIFLLLMKKLLFAHQKQRLLIFAE